MTATHPKFWLVWSPDGGAPTVKHPTFQAAEWEASRLATKFPGRQFFVLSAKRGFSAGADGPTLIRMTPAPAPAKQQEAAE